MNSFYIYGTMIEGREEFSKGLYPQIVHFSSLSLTLFSTVAVFFMSLIQGFGHLFHSIIHWETEKFLRDIIEIFKLIGIAFLINIPNFIQLFTQGAYTMFMYLALNGQEYAIAKYI